ncbi:hypothetical protein Q7P35_008959 [Cladosporium inversicolor]
MVNSRSEPDPPQQNQNKSPLRTQIAPGKRRQCNQGADSPSTISAQHTDGTSAEGLQFQPGLATTSSHKPFSQTVGKFVDILSARIEKSKLGAFKIDRSDVYTLANLAAQRIDHFAIEWSIPLEILPEIVQLGLYDIVLYIDNSGSMRLEENGERLDDLKVIWNFVAAVHELFEYNPQKDCSELQQQHSLWVCFMNGKSSMKKARDRSEIEKVFAQELFSGLTRLGSGLEEKVLEPLLVKARSGMLHRPVMVLVVTDGGLSLEHSTALSEMLVRTYKTLGQNYRSQTAPEILSVQFAQVGNDPNAQGFLTRMKLDTRLRQRVDCTPNFEVLQEMLYTASPPARLTPGSWLMKTALGAIDASYEVDSVWSMMNEDAANDAAEHSGSS